MLVSYKLLCLRYNDWLLMRLTSWFMNTRDLMFIGAKIEVAIDRKFLWFFSRETGFLKYFHSCIALVKIYKSLSHLWNKYHIQRHTIEYPLYTRTRLKCIFLLSLQWEYRTKMSSSSPARRFSYWTIHVMYYEAFWWVKTKMHIYANTYKREKVDTMSQRTAYLGNWDLIKKTGSRWINV